MEEKLKFEWDKSKARLNFKKHNVTFEEAATVFYDPLGRIGEDVLHSYNEFRDVVVGCSTKGRLLIVSYTERGDKIRIVNARKATKHERSDYEENVI
ncbi:MAG: BrnT family toxin [Bacteroidota bacterium]|nr:BrnT family toxin [Bacteroidota bacterium]